MLAQLLDPEILAAAKKDGVEGVSKLLEQALPDSVRGETRCVCF